MNFIHQASKPFKKKLKSPKTNQNEGFIDQLWTLLRKEKMELMELVQVAPEEAKEVMDQELESIAQDEVKMHMLPYEVLGGKIAGKKRCWIMESVVGKFKERGMEYMESVLDQLEAAAIESQSEGEREDCWEKCQYLEPQQEKPLNLESGEQLISIGNQQTIIRVGQEQGEVLKQEAGHVLDEQDADKDLGLEALAQESVRRGPVQRQELLLETEEVGLVKTRQVEGQKAEAVEVQDGLGCSGTELGYQDCKDDVETQLTTDDVPERQEFRRIFGKAKVRKKMARYQEFVDDGKKRDLAGGPEVLARDLKDGTVRLRKGEYGTLMRKKRKKRRSNRGWNWMYDLKWKLRQRKSGMAFGVSGGNEAWEQGLDGVIRSNCMGSKNIGARC